MSVTQGLMATLSSFILTAVVANLSVTLATVAVGQERGVLLQHYASRGQTCLELMRPDTHIHTQTHSTLSLLSHGSFRLSQGHSECQDIPLTQSYDVSYSKGADQLTLMFSVERDRERSWATHVKQVLSERLAALLREQICASGYISQAEVCARLCIGCTAVKFVSPHCN